MKAINTKNQKLRKEGTNMNEVKIILNRDNPTSSKKIDNGILSVNVLGIINETYDDILNKFLAIESNKGGIILTPNYMYNKYFKFINNLNIENYTSYTMKDIFINYNSRLSSSLDYITLNSNKDEFIKNIQSQSNLDKFMDYVLQNTTNNKTDRIFNDWKIEYSELLFKFENFRYYTLTMITLMIYVYIVNTFGKQHANPILTIRSVNEIHIYGLNDILSENPEIKNRISDTFLTHIYPKLIINHVLADPFIPSFIGELVDSPQYLSNKFIIATDLES